MGTDHETTPRPQHVTADGGFARVVCGVSGTREGFEAVRQAARMTSPGGHLLLVAVVELYAALSGRWGAEPSRWRVDRPLARSVEESMDLLRERARASLADAESQAGGSAAAVTAQVLDGDVDVVLLDAVRSDEATLIAVGAHNGGRLAAASMSETTAVVLHDAPVSVLVARPPFDPERFPASIVVGIDGSPEARAALEVAAGIRRRSGGRLTVVSARGDQESAVTDLDGFTAPHELIVSPSRPVDALVDAASAADLLVVGSRGLHGRKALGSVSERVAFRAPSSVLVVRPGAPPAAEA